MNVASDDDTDDRTVLTVRVASSTDAFDELEQRFESLDAGTRPTPLYEIVLQREEDLTRLLNPNNVELLRTIARESPASIRETARLVDRDVRQVHDDLTELARLNLLAFVEDGRADTLHGHPKRKFMTRGL
jgi:predicted transcriptional regulator